MKHCPLAEGKVEALCRNGEEVSSLLFDLQGPSGDRHTGYSRGLSGHDGAYLRTSALPKGALVFNWRSWTGVSAEEMREVEKKLGRTVPSGCILENIRVSGIPNFSKLPPTSRLVFPPRGSGHTRTQAILAVWEENGPCATAGGRVAVHHGELRLKAKFVEAALGKRGVMGFVLSAGWIEVGDSVRVFPPVE